MSFSSAPVLDVSMRVITGSLMNSISLLIDQVWSYPNCLYLNGVIVEKYSITVLLRRNLRAIATENVASSLFKRNKQLRGQLTTIKCKHYSDTDTNSNGTSRRDWRLIHMEADEDFLRSLEAFPEDHHFALGLTGTTIRGGVRPESKKKAGRERR